MRIAEVIDAATPPPRRPVDYTEVNRRLRVLRGQLTRAKNTDPRAVILAVAKAFDAFDEEGMIWPDGWPTWTVAFDDACLSLEGVDFDRDDPVLAAVAKVERRRP